mmetsp:Transcript_15455/g.34700  ORF Transcript_15455/g.34700 Transcript_15455/m.34700 type:complete len:88 (-) Transcript_15455:1646-1909(-)
MESVFDNTSVHSLYGKTSKTMHIYCLQGIIRLQFIFQFSSITTNLLSNLTLLSSCAMIFLTTASNLLFLPNCLSLSLSLRRFIRASS